MKRFKKIAKMSQSELKITLVRFLKLYYQDVISEDGFIFAKGNIPILLTAHLDTVHEKPIKRIYKNKDRLFSPQGIGGDDRCGVWIITEVIRSGLQPNILFCEDEEIGGVGSDKFCKTKYIADVEEMKYVIELDRKGNNDAVYYDCGNEEFKKYIEENTGFAESYGSFSDIGHICPDADIAGVNLSCGYYNAHTLQEYVVFGEMRNTLKVVKELLENPPEEKFDYQELYYFGYGYGNYYDRFHKKDTFLFVSYYKEDKGFEQCVNGESEYECWGKFFLDNKNLSFNDVLDYSFY